MTTIIGHLFCMPLDSVWYMEYKGNIINGYHYQITKWIDEMRTIIVVVTQMPQILPNNFTCGNWNSCCQYNSDKQCLDSHFIEINTLC